MSDPKLAAARASLREALSETDDRGTRFYIREALQHLAILESRRDRDGTEPGDDGDGDDGMGPVLSVGPRGNAAVEGDIDALETAEFPAQELDRN